MKPAVVKGKIKSITSVDLTNPPKLSVIMNCLNCQKYLKEAIDSVYSQTCMDWEIIFWDNASTDKSAEIARSYDGRLRYIKGNKTIPLGEARNLAIEQARGEYIAFLDCDDVWLPEKLEMQMEYLESNKDAVLIFSDSFVIDDEGSLIRETFLEDQRFYSGFVFEKLLYYNFIPILTTVVSRKLLEEVGAFNTNYRFVEDYDLLLKIAEHNRIHFLDKPLAKYRIHRTNLSKNVDLLVMEELQLVDYWMNKKNDFNNDIKKAINRKKIFLHLRLLKFYIMTFRYSNALKEIMKILKILCEYKNI